MVVRSVGARAAVFALLLAPACDGGAASASASDFPAASAGAQGRGRPDPAPQAIAAQRRSAITEAVVRVAPSVVTVQTEAVRQVTTFDLFFGAQNRPQTSSGIGSGFVFRADGVILTNAHVIAGASKVVVATRDGQTYTAKVLGSDELNDLAVLQIPARNLPVAALGTSRDLVIGEWAIAIGNPFGFVLDNTEPSVTAGVISATGRNLTARSEGGGVYVDMIQTDASINPGNSGGPLVNALGEVIGVNSSIYSPTGSSVGLGFAIPIDRARRVADDLIAHGKARQPWIGVRLGEAPAAGTERTGTPRRGAVVSQVTPESPAASVGIRVGDVIVRSRERTLRNAYDWEAEQLELRVGERVPLTIRRGTRELDVTVTVADRPEVTAERVSVLRDIELVDVTAAIRAEHSIRNSGGALIVTVAARVSETLGVQAGDVIVQVMNTPIRDARHAKQVLEAYSGRGRLRMFVERGGQIFSTDFQIR
ncbi:MAG: trypsin-like serine protease [Gemmatimonadetes bacterium]|nr:trypsin-like serine protease [Gemmatimonadota bacterium]